MSLVRSLRLVLSPPHPAGRPFIYGGLAVAVLGGLLLGGWLFWPGLIFTLFCLYFFRDPRRVAPEREGLVLAPADGRIVSIMPAVPPEELGLGPAPRWRVAISTSISMSSAGISATSSAEMVGSTTVLLTRNA
jgi:phosphatidylserine decarboxylase